MRVIAGEVRGFRLKGPPSFSTRPMTDKIKGALFSMLASLGVEPDRVLDLYAGTGSLGIEALSRGASWAEFVEHNAAAAAVVRANISLTRYDDSTLVHQMAIKRFLNQAKIKEQTAFDLVIMDPPYADPEILSMLQQVSESALVQSGSTIVIGYSPRVELPDSIGSLELVRDRCHGDSCFRVYDVISRCAGYVPVPAGGDPEA